MLIPTIRETLMYTSEKVEQHTQISKSFSEDDVVGSYGASFMNNSRLAKTNETNLANLNYNTPDEPYTNTFIEKDNDKYDVESVGTYNNENKFFDLKSIHDEVFTNPEEVIENVNIGNAGPLKNN